MESNEDKIYVIPTLLSLFTKRMSGERNIWIITNKKRDNKYKIKSTHNYVQLICRNSSIVYLDLFIN